MNDIIVKEKIIIENLIYEVRGKQVMLDSEIAVTKCHDYYYKIVAHYDIGKPISVIINFSNISTRLKKNSIGQTRLANSERRNYVSKN